MIKMNKNVLKKLKNKILLKYLWIVPIFCLVGASTLYILDNVLDGMIVDLLSILFIDADPFVLFDQLFSFALPLFIVFVGFILVYFLCKELIHYLKVIMDGIDDVFFKNRDKLYFEKTLQPLEAFILKLDEEKHAYEV